MIRFHKPNIKDQGSGRLTLVFFGRLIPAAVFLFFIAVPGGYAQSIDMGATLADYPQEILIGGLFDFTGPTSAYSRDYARGASDAVKFINQKGGIEGSPLRLMVNDYGSRPIKALEVYNRYVYFNEAFILLGWGKADTQELAPKANQNKVVYLTADFEAELTDPRKNPYIFSIGASYSDQARSAMKWAVEHDGKTVCFVYPNRPFGHSPIRAAKAYAEELGLVMEPDIFMDLKATDATDILRRLSEIAPDFVWVGNVAPSTTELLDRAAQVNFPGKFLINNWGMNDDLAQNMADGLDAKVFGFLEVRAFHSEVPAQKDMQSIIGTERFSRYYSLGWASILVLAEGLHRAKATGNLSGPGLKIALETLRDFETGGLTPSITYTAEDHRPTTNTWLYSIKDSRLFFVTETGIERTNELLGW